MPPEISRTYAPLAGLVGLLTLIKLFDVVVAPEHVYPGRTAAFSWLELGLVAVAALLGAMFAHRSALVQIWPKSSTLGPVLLAFALGLALGTGLAVLDAWLRIGDINVGLPLAPVFYLWGGISQEILTHFAPIAVVVGVLAIAGTSTRAQAVSFWVVALAMSSLTALGMAEAFQNPDIPLSANVTAAPIVIAVAVFVIELALFTAFRRLGFLAALATRLGFYAIWHIAWPAIAY